MTPANLVDNLTARGVVVTICGDSLDIDAPRGLLNDDDIKSLREHKAALMRWLRLAEGLPVDDDAARLLDSELVDPEAVPSCLTCGRYSDVLTLADEWRCSKCDPQAKDRKMRTLRLLSFSRESARATLSKQAFKG